MADSAGMKFSTRDLIKRILNNVGLDVTRYAPLEQGMVKSGFLPSLLHHGIDLVLDVGANNGNWAASLFKVGYKGKIVSFEPLSSVYDQLLKRSRDNENWTVFERCAIGEINGEVEMNVSANSVSSSVLPVLPNSTDVVPESAYIGTEKVKLCRLSEVAKVYVEQARATLLKIDVQGYEDRVLEGALEILPKIKGVHLELEVTPLYEGQKLFEDMLQELKRMGFALYNLDPFFRNYRTGKLLSLDGTFFREL